ncbi:MAG: hypothetical protein ACRDK3_02055 [Actinomycetota bacterium]
MSSQNGMQRRPSQRAARGPFVAVVAFMALLLVPTHAAGQLDPAFMIGYGDTVSDGVPAPGAGNIEVGGATDSYSFEATAGDVAIFDVLQGSAGNFRWRLSRPPEAPCCSTPSTWT